jgi:hypothetical protein
MKGFSQGSRSISCVHNTAECMYTVGLNIEESTWPKPSGRGGTKGYLPGMTTSHSHKGLEIARTAPGSDGCVETTSSIIDTEG